jgi:hypothetical protein
MGGPWTRLGAVLAALAAAALLAPMSASGQTGPLKAGVAVVDGSWHVGASAGQYASDGSFVHPSEGNYDPTALSTRRQSSYGMQSRLQIRALVVEGPSGERFALVKNDLYIPQDLLWRRTAQLLEAGDSEIGRDSLMMAVSHNHSSPYYSSTSWGAWTFQDVFDVRFYNYYAQRMADAVEEAADNLVPVRVGAAVTQFDKTHRHSFGPAIAEDGTPGTPAGYPNSDADHDTMVVRFDDISDPGSPKPLANVVNFPLHPEFLDGNDLISEDYLAPLEKMTDDATGAVTIFTQGAVGTAEPERSSYHSIHERLEFTHREYGQAEYGARLMSDTLVELSEAIGDGAPAASWQQRDKDRFVPFESDFDPEEVGFEDRWFPGPLTRPYPGVSNCNTDAAFANPDDPPLPIIGLPDCKGARESLQDFFGVPVGGDVPLPIDPGITTHDLDRLGIPVPTSYSAPGYTGLHEDINVHLQAFRIGDMLFAGCSCELWADQARNTKTRTDRVAGNEYLGYDWKNGGGAVAGGPNVNLTGHPIPPGCSQVGDGTYGTGPEGYGTGKWNCPNPHNPSQQLTGLSDEQVERMHRQVVNPANGWNDAANVLEAESEPADVRRIFGNFTHDEGCQDPAATPPTAVNPKPMNDWWTAPCGPGETPPSADLGYKLTVAIGMVNDYNGYIASYREYRRGDHYRKALTGWGPHSSDYMSSRLVNMGRVLRGGDPDELLPRENPQGKVEVDVGPNGINDQRARALGEGGTAVTEAYEAELPDDGGEPGAVTQPQDGDEPFDHLERFDAAFFTWIGGSNYTDDPFVKVQRRVGGQWRDYAGQAGEVPITVEYPDFEDTAPYEAGQHEWRWTAHFEAFASRFDSVEGRRATPAGIYRFVVDGQRRRNKQPEPYHVESEPFQVRPWSGITVTDMRLEDDGTVSFAVGPTSRDKPHRNVDNNNQTVIVPEVGPIDYPDSYDHGEGGPLPPFIQNRPVIKLEPGNPDPAAGETFCFDCSFRPWIDFADATEALVTVSGAGGTEQVPATRQGDRWRTTRALGPGESARVGVGCVKDAFGNYNGAASAGVGSDPAAEAAACPVEQPGDGDGDGGGDGGGGGSGGGGGGSGSGGGTVGQVGQAITYVLTGCARPTGRVRGRRLGRTRLGFTRRRVRSAYPRRAQPRRSVDRFCLTDGRHLRVGYPTGGALRSFGRAHRRRVAGRAVLVLSSSRRYRIRGITRGARVRALRARFPRARSFRIGSNRWYLARGRRARLVFKVRGGRVREVGIADLALTRGRRPAKRFMRGFS